MPEPTVQSAASPQDVRDPSSRPAPALTPIAARFLARAQRESASGDVEAASRSMAKVLALAPNHPEALRWAGITAYNVGDYGRAAAAYRQCLASLPDDANLHIGLGVAVYKLGRRDEGLAELRRACDVAPDSPAAWYNLAEMLRLHAQPDAALSALQRTLALDSTHVPARISLANVQISVGQLDAAAENLRAVLRQDPARVEAWSALANLKTRAFSAEDVARLERGMAEPALSAGGRVQLEFVLAHALEDQGDYERAWSVLQRANDARHRSVKWDAVGEHKRVEAMLAAFLQPIARATDAQLGDAVICIASLPRSGSTLVEQILASHPLVEGANEIGDLKTVIDAETRRRRSAFPLWVPQATAADWQRLGTRYLERTSRWRRLKPRMVDKNLLNWLLAGTIASMLPGARTVVVRRDPVETCLGCYRQWFDGEEGFSFDLDDLAEVYIDFWRVTRLWLQRFPDRVFELRYEALVEDTEPTVRRLLDFLGLPFDPACLEFYKTERAVLSAPSAAQVRQPLHKTARAARYAHKLDHLRERLHAAGLPVAAPES